MRSDIQTLLTHSHSSEKPDLSKDVISRRRFIGGLAGALACVPALTSPGAALAGTFSHAITDAGKRNISLRHIHTGETFSGAYRIGDEYIYEAFERINALLRDFRTGDVYPIDPRLIDVLWQINQKTSSKYPFQLLSGYRSPKTNLKLARNTDGVAMNSFHMSGQALDIRVPYYDTREVRNIAVGLRAGGVGYYSKSNFVHLDTGTFRTW